LLPVVFSIDNSSDSGACTIKLPTVSFTGVGTCVIDANQAGDAIYAPAKQVQQTVQVKAAPKITYATPNPGTSADCTKAKPCSLPDAVAAVKEGGTVMLAGGTYSGVALDLTKSVTLQAEQGAMPVLQGKSSAGVIDVKSFATVALTGLTLTGGENGIYNEGGTMTVARSTISGNQAEGIVTSSTLTVTDSTISGNGGLGISNGGRLTVTDSTISGNGNEGIVNIGAVTVNSSTISGNRFGGIDSVGGTMTLGGDIVAGNNPDCPSAAVTDAGGNIDSDGTCGFGSGRGSVSGSSSIVGSLGTLADNGGPTQTIALKPGSPALGIVPSKFCAPTVPTDQRGEPRPTSRCDAGAYELTPAVTPVSGVSTTYTPTSPVAYGNRVTYSTTVTGTADRSAPQGTVDLTAIGCKPPQAPPNCSGARTTIASSLALTPGSNNVSTAQVTSPAHVYPPDQHALVPGAYRLTTTYHPASGSPYEGRSSASSETVRKAAVKLTGVTASPASVNHNVAVDFSATVTPTTLRGLPPTGTVRFYADDGTGNPTPVCADNDVQKSGTANQASASCSSNSLAPGSYTITARYFGDGNYQQLPHAAGSATLTVTPVADLSVGVTADANLSRSGDQSSRRGNGLVSYTVTVTNNGPDAADNVTVSDVLPATATGPRGRSVLAEFVSDDGQCSGEPRPYTASRGQTVSCDLGTINAGDSKSVTFDFALFSRSRARSPYAFGFTDTASASSGTFDPDTSNNAGKATLTYRMR
jgi:hypothetical protein